MSNPENLFKPTRDIQENYPTTWPPVEFFTLRDQVTQEQYEEFERLITDNASETKIDVFLRLNPCVLSTALAFVNTGHHGSWIIPQQSIRPKIGNIQAGLIPDYIMGGKNSDGFQWWVIELKGANASIFTKRKNDISFSTTLNEGVCQLLTYIDYCAEIQSTLRDQFKLTDFREPKGMIFIGREHETEDDAIKRKLKAAWNRTTRGNLEIRSYDSLLRSLREIMRTKPDYSVSGMTNYIVP